MAIELWLLRHGDAAPHGSAPDSQRALTAKGERQSRAAAAALGRLDAAPTACYSSPKVRARDTARLVCAPLGVDVQEVDALAGAFGVEEASELLLAHADGERVLLVGHEPDLSQLVHGLTGARIELKKGGLAVVAARRREGELLALLRPTELALLAG